MEASLLELLEGHSRLKAWLDGLGITSVRDVKWFWDDSSLTIACASWNLRGRWHVRISCICRTYI